MRSGIINVYKEVGFTSFDVVAKLRGILHFRKIGHTGTLDPDAVGVLPVCIGKATRVVDLLTDKDKVYVADLLLGTTTDTYDTSGQVLTTAEVNVPEDRVRAAVAKFIGDIKQVPPMYSALKVNGKKLYELARKGIEVEREARDITVFDIEIQEINLPHVIMKVHCSKGTYIRSLCHDIGQELGCGGCMAHLERVRVAQFTAEDALTLSQIEEMRDQGRLDEIILPIDGVFEGLPKLYLPMIWKMGAINGSPVPEDSLLDCKLSKDGLEDAKAVTEDACKFLMKADKVRVYLEDGTFIGIYQGKGHLLKVSKMFYEGETDND